MPRLLHFEPESNLYYCVHCLGRLSLADTDGEGQPSQGIYSNEDNALGHLRSVHGLTDPEETQDWLLGADELVRRARQRQADVAEAGRFSSYLDSLTSVDDLLVDLG